MLRNPLPLWEKAGLPLALARLDRAAIYGYGIGNRLGPA